MNPLLMQDGSRSMNSTPEIPAWDGKEVERLRGAASRPYIDFPGIQTSRCGKATPLQVRERGVAIINAKKETAYMFADELLALHDPAPVPISRILQTLKTGVFRRSGKMPGGSLPG